MNEEINEVVEQVNESVNPYSESVQQDSETSVVEEVTYEDSSTDSDRTDEVADEVAEDLNQEEETEEEERPTSTVIQVIEDEDSEDGYSISELDVESLNIMSESYVEQMLAVTPTSNDYYDFLPDTIVEYFSGIMANYPLNEYRAYHLRHWINNGQYYSYYDDYYYLFYDYDGESPEQCIEVYKANGSSSYGVTVGTAEVLNASIMYGSDEGMSDIRKGVSYVQEMALLCSIGIVAVLFVLRAIFEHIRG